MTRRSRWLGAICFALVLSGCASSLKIRDILDNPARYNGRSVQIHGVVTKTSMSLGRGAYELSDNTGSILIVAQEAPRHGSSLKVQGTFRSSFNWGDGTVAAIVE
jgi:hypothetical protein